MWLFIRFTTTAKWVGTNGRKRQHQGSHSSAAREHHCGGAEVSGVSSHWILIDACRSHPLGGGLGKPGTIAAGGKKAKRQANQQHPFGYGRERYIYSFLVAIVLFSVGGLFALYEAYEKWQHPEPIEGFWWWLPLVVLAGAIVAESFSIRTAIRESRSARVGLGWMEFIRKTKSPELAVILLEDFAALTGLTFAFLAVSASLITGNSIWDALGTALIGLLLVTVAIVLGIETKSLLLGEAAGKEDTRRIQEALAENDTAVIDLKTMHLGPDELLVAARIAIRSSDTGDDVAVQIRRAEQCIRDAVPVAKTIYLEPDIYSNKAAPSDETV